MIKIDGGLRINSFPTNQKSRSPEKESFAVIAQKRIYLQVKGRFRSKESTQESIGKAPKAELLATEFMGLPIEFHGSADPVDAIPG